MGEGVQLVARCKGARRLLVAVHDTPRCLHYIACHAWRGTLQIRSPSPGSSRANSERN
jgi:hypothetical protein